MIVKLEATLNNIYKGRDFRDKETGEVRQGKTYIQIMADDVLGNGQVKKQLIDMPIAEAKAKQYEPMLGKTIELKCNISSKDKIYYEAI